MRPGPLPMPEALGNKAFACRSFERMMVVKNHNPLIFLEGKHGIEPGSSADKKLTLIDSHKPDPLSLTASLHLKIGRNQNP